MKKILLPGIMFALFSILSASTADAAQSTGTVYTSSRYDFSLTLPPGYLSLVEPENGDGITVTYGSGMTLKAYGTMAPLVFSTDCATMYGDARDTLDQATYTRLNEKERWFVVSGYREGNIVYSKQFVGKTAAYVLEMVYPPEHARDFDAFVRAVVGSFSPGDME